MTTVPQYVDTFKNALVNISNRLGVDPAGSDKPTRAIAIAQLALLATVVKVLVDKGVCSDAELQAAFNDAIAIAWPEQASSP